MFRNAAIIGVGQSAYTRRPEPGQTVLHFMRDAAVAALKDAQLSAKDIQGFAVASFSLAPDAAVDLAWKLGLVIGGRAPATLLATYHDERWPVGQKVLQRTDRLFSVVSSQEGWTTRVRNVVVPYVAPTLARIAPVRARAFAFVSQLGIRYREGAFVADAAPRQALRAWRKGVRAGRCVW